MLIRKCLRGPDLTANQRAVLFWCLCPVCSYKQRGEKSGQWTQHLTDVWQSLCVCEGSDRGVFVSWFMRSVTIGQPWIYAPPLPNLPPNTHTHTQRSEMTVRWGGSPDVFDCCGVCVVACSERGCRFIDSVTGQHTHTHTPEDPSQVFFSTARNRELLFTLPLSLWDGFVISVFALSSSTNK